MKGEDKARNIAVQHHRHQARLSRHSINNKKLRLIVWSAALFATICLPTTTDALECNPAVDSGI